MTAEESEQILDELEATMLKKAKHQASNGYYSDLATLTRGMLNIVLYRRVKAGGGVKVDADGGLGLPEAKGGDDGR